MAAIMEKVTDGYDVTVKVLSANLKENAEYPHVLEAASELLNDEAGVLRKRAQADGEIDRWNAVKDNTTPKTLPK